MAKKTGAPTHDAVKKKTSQGGTNPKLAGMNKSTRQSYKPYRGQGRGR